MYYNDTAERVDIRMMLRDDNDIGVCVTYEPSEAVVNDAREIRVKTVHNINSEHETSY